MNNILPEFESSILVKLGFTGNPTHYEVLQWFRDNHNLFGQVEIDCTSYPKFAYAIYFYSEKTGIINAMAPRAYSDLYYKYEEAELDCIKYLITFICD